MNRRQCCVSGEASKRIDAFQFTFRSCKCYTVKNNVCRRVRDKCSLHATPCRIDRSQLHVYVSLETNERFDH